MLSHYWKESIQLCSYQIRIYTRQHLNILSIASLGWFYWIIDTMNRQIKISSATSHLNWLYFWIWRNENCSKFKTQPRITEELKEASTNLKLAESMCISCRNFLSKLFRNVNWDDLTKWIFFSFPLPQQNHYVIFLAICLECFVQLEILILSVFLEFK